MQNFVHSAPYYLSSTPTTQIPMPNSTMGLFVAI
jgi:hypothetical protein